MVLARLVNSWERIAPLLAGLGMIIFLLMGAIMLYQQRETVRILNEHTTTLQEVSQLRAQVTGIVDKAGPQITAGQKLLLNRLSWIECAISVGSASCGPRP